MSEEKRQTSPERWVDLAAKGGPSRSAAPSTVEARIGSVLAKVPVPPAWSRAAEARVLARLGQHGKAPRVLVYLRFAMGSGLGLVLLFLSGAVVAAGGVGAWWKLAHHEAKRPPQLLSLGAPQKTKTKTTNTSDRRSGRPARPDLVPPHVAGEPAPGAVPSSAEVPSLQPPTVEAAAAVPAASAPAAEAPARAAAEAGADGALALPRAPRVTARQPAAERDTATVESGNLGQETALLHGALLDLRKRRDGSAALASLDEYLRRFPSGVLVNEAARARVDALLLLGRDGEALGALDGLELPPLGRGLELRLIRGELRAVNDCRRALDDFDALLGRTAPPALAERALRGRAICFARMGRRDDARSEAAAYLRRFPTGRFAAEARRLSAPEAPAAPGMPAAPAAPGPMAPVPHDR